MNERPAPEQAASDPAALAQQRAAFAEALLAARAEMASEMARLQAGHDALRNSRMFRTASALSEALRRPWRLPALPLQLWRIARGDVVVSAHEAVATPASPRLPRPGGGGFRLAALVDPFTALGLEGECDLLLVTPDTTAAELDDFRPQMLLVESAWAGHDGRWRDQLAPPSPGLLALLAQFVARGVPTVFWNKEDPSHFEHFLATAQLFDVVLTTDADCVPRYQARTGRRDVGVMAFACQPRCHHPVDAGERESAFLFAGSHYARYPERARDFDSLVASLPPGRELHIYDRNHGSDQDQFRFPAHHRDAIRGSVPPDGVAALYRRYDWAINVNTIKDSPTMLSRRVPELLACNTLVLSNASKAMASAFGDAVVAGPDADVLAALLADPLARARRRLRGLRAVMRGFTWAHRVAQLRALVEPGAGPLRLPDIQVFALAGDAASAARLQAQFLAQDYPGASLCLVVPGALAAAIAPAPGVRVMDEATAASTALPPGPFMAWDDADAHGPHLLLDLALSARYWPAAAVGKSSSPGQAYQSADRLPLRASLVFDASLVPARTVAGLLASLDGELSAPGALLRIDTFNFSAGGRGDLPASASDQG